MVGPLVIAVGMVMYTMVTPGASYLFTVLRTVGAERSDQLVRARPARPRFSSAANVSLTTTARVCELSESKSDTG